MKWMVRLFVFLALLFAVVPSYAAVANVYFDTGGCQTGSTVQCSGTTDSASATVSSASATITCSATTGPAAAPGCSLTGAPSLAGIAVDGSQAIYVDCATNTNQKIFFINALDDALDLVGTTVTPTGCTAATSAWGIGGRMIYNSANWEAAPRAGDTFVFNNTPATKTTDFLTKRVSGSFDAGYINVVGKAGVRPVLAVSNTNQIIDGSTNFWRFSNLEFAQAGASGSCVIAGTDLIFDNILFSDCGGIAFDSGSNSVTWTITNSKITGAGSHGVATGTANWGNTFVLKNDYITGNGGAGIFLVGNGAANGTLTIDNTIISGNTARGIFLSTGISSLRALISNTTIYNNGDSGLEVNDTGYGVMLYNSIFKDNGSTVGAGAYNVEFVAGAAEIGGSHGYNDFNQTGGSAGNLLGLTANSTEVTTDPLFTNAAGADFSLQSSSPAKATGIPGLLLGSSTTGYMSMGAAQVQATTGSGTHGLIIGN